MRINFVAMVLCVYYDSIASDDRIGHMVFIYSRIWEYFRSHFELDSF